MTKSTTLQKGFTLTELVIAIAIIGILASLAVVSFNGVAKRSRANAVTTELKNIAEALDLYVQKTNLTSWPADASMTASHANDPLITTMIGENAVLKNYIAKTPVVQGLESLTWHYDNDGNNYVCHGTWNYGTNIFLKNFTDVATAKIIDDAIDNDNDLDCGKVRYNGTTFVYSLSFDSTIR
jgi:prepilin-type N-terminal cleavage/methylation domain-containing protein